MGGREGVSVVAGAAYTCILLGQRITLTSPQGVPRLGARTSQAQRSHYETRPRSPSLILIISGEAGTQAWQAQHSGYGGQESHSDLPSSLGAAMTRACW